MIRIFYSSIQTAKRNALADKRRRLQAHCANSPSHSRLNHSMFKLDVGCSMLDVGSMMFPCLTNGLSFVRFTHTVFALPFALAAMAVAARANRGWPGWRTFGLILAAMVCARTCAMAFNRIVDRKFDALNPRTAGRHLPTGQISLAERGDALCARRRGPGRRQFPAESALLLPLAGRAGGHLLLFVDQALHRLHACLSWTGAGAGAGGRVAGGEGDGGLRPGDSPDGRAGGGGGALAGRLRHHLRPPGL